MESRWTASVGNQTALYRVCLKRSPELENVIRVKNQSEKSECQTEKKKKNGQKNCGVTTRKSVNKNLKVARSHVPHACLPCRSPQPQSHVRTRDPAFAQPLLQVSGPAFAASLAPRQQERKIERKPAKTCKTRKPGNQLLVHRSLRRRRYCNRFRLFP